MVDRSLPAPPGAPPKTPLELWREIAQLHLCITSAMRELDELMAQWLIAQGLGDEPKGGAA